MRHFICILLLSLSLFSISFASDMPGSAIYVKLTGDAYDAYSDVYEKNLTNDNIKKIIDHISLPKDYQGRIDRVLPASDGSLLLLKESNTYIIRNNATGAIRKVFGNEYSTIGNEVLAKEIKGNCWIWSRTDGKIRRINLSSVNSDFEPLSWSPKGRLLLLSTFNTKTNKESIYLYNASTGKTKILRTSAEFVFAKWVPDASSILIAEQSNSTATRLSIISLSGKVKSIKTRPKRIFTAAVSPDNRLVIGDTGGFYIIDTKKQTQQKLAIPVSEGWLDGDVVFSVDGKTLAILSSVTSSGLYADVDESLWSIDLLTLKAALIRKWNTTLGNSPGEDETHALLVWVPKQSALYVMGRSCTIQGAETEWRKLWYIPVDSTQSDKKVFDTGPCGIHMSWWNK